MLSIKIYGKGTTNKGEKPKTDSRLAGLIWKRITIVKEAKEDFNHQNSEAMGRCACDRVT